ncbi:hypothetical protein BC831DRAFT_274876 [Entophlyctis helioformis]|nr:hypothetical protein BC831DRAFT_274876 [Entophlyctis helioformis]
MDGVQGVKQQSVARSAPALVAPTGSAASAGAQRQMDCGGAADAAQAVSALAATGWRHHRHRHQAGQPRRAGEAEVCVG